LSLCVLNSRAREGIQAPAVTVEVHLAGGLPALSIVGLPELAVKESKDRVRGALLNSRFWFPVGRVTINLAPADLPKEGGRFDLPIAAGVLGASGQLKCDLLGRLELLGELALSGDLRPVAGVLPVALAARDAGRALVLPRENADEAALVSGLTISRNTCSRSANTSTAPPCCPHSSACTWRRPRSSIRTWRRSGVRSRQSAPWRLPQWVVTASCFSAPQAPANPCSPTGCPASCRS